MRCLNLIWMPLLAIQLTLPAQSEQQKPNPTLLGQWTRDLQHTEHGRREAAIEQLARAGRVALAWIRPLCDDRDPVLANSARRVFAHVTGTSPEVFDEVQGLVGEVRAGDLKHPAFAKGVLDAGPGAVAVAERSLRDKSGTIHPALAELLVQRGLHDLAAGLDLDGQASRSVRNLGSAATEPLLRWARSPGSDTTVRLHALWLHASLGQSKRASILAPLLADGDAAVRRAATGLVVSAIGPEDFAAVADVIGIRPSPERAAVAAVLASRMDEDAAIRTAQRRSRRGALAAVVLGHMGTDAARKALVDTAGNVGNDLGHAQAVVAGLALVRHEDTTKALTRIFANADKSPLRASAAEALRHRMDDAAARTALVAGAFDVDPMVRHVAVDALASSGRKSVTPALIVAAAEEDGGLRNTALNAVERILDGETARSGDGAAQRWTRWLRRQGPDLHEDELPWYRASTEAARVIDAVRGRVNNEFFHFGKEELVEMDALNKAAIASMRKLLDSGENLDADDVERQLLQRVFDNASDPMRALQAVGTIPFQTKVSDLVRLTDAGASGITGSLGDRYSRVQASNDPEGKVRPGWLPGLLDDEDAVTNGFYVNREDDVLRVGFVLFDSPAYYAGVQVGDQLLRIDDDFAKDLEPKDLRKRTNEEAKFTFLRQGWNRPYAFELVPTKDDPDRLVTRVMLPGKIGYVRLKMFDAGCSSKIETAVKALEKEGAQSLILDLRNNPGGTVVDATNIVDLFLPSGKLICTNEYRDGLDDTRDEEIRSTAKGADRDIPLAVLVNESSASASEMTSGSLQGNDRAIVIGQQSFGKGIGQSGMTVPGFSSDTALGRTSSVYLVYLTMMRYYLPEGRRSIHNVGVEPDLAVRERNLRGSKLDKIMRAAGNKAFGKYVETLLCDHAELAAELARFDGDEATRYPELDGLLKKVKRYVSEDELRGLVRAEVRRRLLRDADKDSYQKMMCDVQEDRTLQAAIRELADKTKLDLATVPELARIAR